MLLELDSWEAWPADLELPSQHFVLLLAADALNTPASKIAHFARRAIDTGCSYLCAWGPACGFVHDVFDEEYLGLGDEPDQPTLTTTWHEKDALEDALDFARTTALPPDTFADTTRTLLIAVIDHPDWAHRVRTLLEGVV